MSAKQATQPPAKPAPTATLTALRPGAAVYLGADACIRGRIMAVMIETRGRISYKVVYWAATTRHAQWFDAFELDPALDAPKVKIGF